MIGSNSALPPWWGEHNMAQLGFWLSDYSHDELATRLGCRRETVLQLERCRKPGMGYWLRDVRDIARALRLDPCRLSFVLQEAIYYGRDGR